MSIEESLVKDGPAWVIASSLVAILWKITKDALAFVKSNNKEILEVVKSNTQAVSRLTEIVSHCSKNNKD